MNKIICLFFILFFSAIYAQKSDTLVLKNNDVIIGEIKSMNKGILQIETDYSKDDFKLEWKHVKNISSTRTHIITLSSGALLNGTISKSKTPNKCEIKDIETQTKTEVSLTDIVYIKPVDDSFWDRLDASFDVGIKLTKAENLQQLTINANLGYTAKRWFATGTYKQIQSVQDDSDPIRRIDTDLSYVHLLAKDYFIPLSVTTLSNTEQDIALRIISKAGYGKYILHDNKKYWGVASGLSFNHERYTGVSDANKSLELFLGTDFNLYDLGDFSIQSKVTVFPSLTENKRVRTDFNLDTKYDLPLDFFIKLSFVYNYDNKPKNNAPKDDYVFQTTFGWKLD
ncbi:DUF481 domain-containing protein [Flavobacterium saccharophilum]|uniref:Salt-induced outer membrane protein YdiY n=1 Tax=Flavobacterium saccharophilum TaxID=29534 RepID=A0A1M7AE13_9FLAO|nr:DUF481 domain-containing protein [Flavobacterium saccharophilum]SHL40932.1 Protein of unknown function, DUF481 [Flavobacterium saccharophilum]